VTAKATIAGVAIALPLLLCSIGIPALAGSAVVISIGDGDTLTVNDAGRRITIRLACIDAPETAQSPYGGQSRAALLALAPVGATVTVQGNKKDRYGRTVAEILRGSTNVNLELVRRGDAFVYRQYLSGCDRNAYLYAEKQAETARRGVWSAPGGITSPWDWRRGGSSRPSSSPYPASSSKPSGRYRCAEVGSWAKAQELLKQGHTFLDRDCGTEAHESLREPLAHQEEFRRVGGTCELGARGTHLALMCNDPQEPIF
jgi:endonuclease YncB( thermonuclease family)